MSEHVVIRDPRFVAGTQERPEIGIFTQTHSRRRPSPTGKIEVGERLWMKWSGGPVVATASVQGFREFPNSTAAELRAATQGFRLHDQDDYWNQLPARFFGLAIYVTDEAWLDDPAGDDHSVFRHHAARR